jgi:hypothetical protein
VHNNKDGEMKEIRVHHGMIPAQRAGVGSPTLVPGFTVTRWVCEGGARGAWEYSTEPFRGRKDSVEIPGKYTDRVGLAEKLKSAFGVPVVFVN